ncbi:MAG: hypothetical protein AAGC65_01780 [Mucilaginibacter sp.]|uniref:hypothetical protein n=1 Tax=Mucilaginibacter sp. TaxID=1882438 RepID=UPI0031A6AACD
MKLKLLPFSLIFFFFLIEIISSCKEFIEPSITKRAMILNAPGDNYQSTSYSVNFWWGDVEDALYYRLQVVTQRFDSIGGLVLDTLVKDTKFTQTLDPGNYQWRVRAENGSTQTAFSTPRTLIILASSLTNQTPVLSSPANNTVVTLPSVTFKWGSLYKATSYHLQIDTNNFIKEDALVSDQVLPGQQFTFRLPKEQTYQWRIRAESDSSQSKWSAINQLTFDASAPDIVSLNQPQNNTTVSLPVNLSWNAVSTAVKYKLYLYQADGTTLITGFPVTVSAITYPYNSGNTGDRISWKVSALDAAGNEGKASETRTFTLQ